METTETEAMSALETASAPLQFIGQHPFAVVPHGYQLHDLESMLTAPLRPRGTLHLHDVESFCEVVSKLGGSTTAIYGTVNPPKFVAVFNENGGYYTGWRDHRAIYECPLSTEWTTWLASDGKQMAQADFAKFIEDNLPDIREPMAADMLDIARTLEAKKKVNFSSGVRLQSGETQFVYQEEIQGTAGKGQFAVPEEFVVGIPVLEGGPHYAVTARLRYRISDQGKLTLWYDILRPHKIIEDAVKDVWTAIASKTGKTILRGTP